MRLRLFKNFSLLSPGLWVGVALLLGSAITYLVEQKMLEQATLASLDYFKNLARFITTKEDFVRLRTGAEYEAFDRLIRENFFTSHVVTIKIYDQSGTTIYHSRRPEFVGKAFPDNRSLQKAFLGETVVGLSDLKGSEHVAERQAGAERLVAGPVPAFLAGAGELRGAARVPGPHRAAGGGDRAPPRASPQPAGLRAPGPVADRASGSERGGGEIARLRALPEGLRLPRRPGVGIPRGALGADLRAVLLDERAGGRGRARPGDLPQHHRAAPRRPGGRAAARGRGDVPHCPAGRRGGPAGQRAGGL